MSVTLIFVYMAKDDDVSTEVPSYFLSSLASWAANTALPAATNFVTSTVPNFITQTIPNAIGEVAKGGLSGLYTGADKLLGGILPGGQAFGQGYLGQLYTGADKMLGGYLPNVGGGAANGMGAGYTPQYMKAQAMFDALPGPGSNGLQPGQVGTSFQGNPMSVGSVNTPLASGAGGMSGWDKLAYGIQGAGLLGSIFSGDKGQAQQAAMMMPNTIQPGAGGGGPIANTVKNDPAMNKNTGVGVGSSRGQDPNKTPGLDQVTSGISDKELLGQIESTRKDIEDLLANMEGIDGQNFSPLESARRNSGLGMDTEGQSYFSVSGSF